jgi:hypothetical protein
MLRSTRSKPAVATVASHRRISPRNASYCLDFPLPKALCCNGCRNFADSPSVHIDIDHLNDQERRDAMDCCLLDRSASHTGARFKCMQPWTLATENYIGKTNLVWIENVQSYVSNTHGRINVLTPALSSSQRTQRMGLSVPASPVLATALPNKGSDTEPEDRSFVL